MLGTILHGLYLNTSNLSFFYLAEFDADCLQLDNVVRLWA